MKTFLILFCLLSWLAPVDLMAQDTLSTPSKNAVSVRIEDFQYGLGFYVTHWFEGNYGLRAGLGGYYATYEAQDITRPCTGSMVTLEDSRVHLSVALLRRLLVRQQVAAYVGVESRLSWYINNGYWGRHTIIKPSVLFGIEAFITDYLSMSGEQMLSTEIYLNYPELRRSAYGESFLSVAFYL